MDQGEINKIINEDPEAHAKVLRYGQGSTALVVLRIGADVWTANIGDCEAVLGVRDSEGKSWALKMLVDGLHNARSNEDEKRRVEEAHPGESDAISGEDNRLLGMIAVTRGEYITSTSLTMMLALGDGMFKLPSVYTDKVWTRLDPTMRTAAKLARLSALNVTVSLHNNAHCLFVDQADISTSHRI
jgi:pyruvate dehydrogenase phosphatase